MASYSMIVTTLLVCGFLGHTNSQGDVPDGNQNVYDIFNTFNNLQTTDARIPLSSNPDVTAIPGFEDTNNALKQMCDKNGGADAYMNVARAMREGAECVENIFVMGQQSEDMARYVLTEDLHFIFKSYCPKTPAFKTCTINPMAAIQSCLDPQEKDSVKIIDNVIDALLSFVCYKDGDHIVQFISAHGPECVQSKQQELLQCVITLLDYYLFSHNPNGSSAGLNRPLVFESEDCTLATILQSCIVKKLGECSNPTPANFVDSVFNVILRATPCKEFLTNSSAVSTSTINLLTTSIVFLVLGLI